MTQTLTDAPSGAVQTETLTGHDRCDRCGVQAFARATLPSGGILQFCGHHYSKHESALAQHGASVLDERHRINARPSPSASEV